MPEWVSTIILVIIVYQFGKAMSADKANSDRIARDIARRDEDADR